MKATAQKNGNRITNKQAIELVTSCRHLAALELDEQVEVIRGYDGDGKIGIGFRKSDGALVEFSQGAGLLDKLTMQEISLAGSIEWTSHMLFAERKLCWAAEIGDDGFAKWLGDIRAAIA